MATAQAALTTTDGGLFVNGGLQVVGPNPWADVTAYGATPYASNYACPSNVDQSAAFNAAINAVASSPAGGGTVYVPAGRYCTTKSILLKSSVNLQGANRLATIILFGGTTGAPILSTGAGAAHLAVRDLSLQYGTAGLTSSTCVDLVDAVYFDVANVSCWNAPSTQSPKQNSIVGVHVRSCKANPVPPIGYGRISNLIAYSPESALGSFAGSRGVLIDGTGAGAGCVASQVVGVAVDGYGDIENFQASVEFKAASNSLVSGEYWLGGGDQGIKFTQAAYNTVSNVRVNYTTNTSCNPSTGLGCAVWVDALSYDNVLEHPSFFQPNNNAVLDQGVRTVWLTTGDGTQPTVMPAQVRAGTLAVGGGTAIAKHLSGTDISGSQASSGAYVALNGGIHQWLPGAGQTGALPAGACSSVNVTVPGADTTNTPTPVGAFSNVVANGVITTAQVTGANTVTVSLCNLTGVAYSGAGWGTVRADVWQH